MEPTTRAYTVRLTGDASGGWRLPLWKTHVTANRAVQVWGDWLLTLRGGLPASTIDDPELHSIDEKQIQAFAKASEGRFTVDEAHGQLQQQRVDKLRAVLALSWLSVEAGQGIPDRFVVARETESLQDRTAAVLGRFEQILRQKRVPDAEHASWIATCQPALTAAIRNEAVWVDRAAAFYELSHQFNSELDESWAGDTFLDLIGGAEEYFQAVDLDAGSSGEAKDFVIKAGNWLSANWGAGEKSDSGQIAKKLQLLASTTNIGNGETGCSALNRLLQSISEEPAESEKADVLFKKIKQCVGWKGRPSKGAMALERLMSEASVTSKLWEPVRAKLLEEASDQLAKKELTQDRPEWMGGLKELLQQRCALPYRTTKDLIWEHAVTLDHALRRLSVAHSWIKRAEAERRRFAADAARIRDVSPSVVDLLNGYCEWRGTDSGSITGYGIRKSAIDGWELVVRAWSAGDCKAAVDRTSAVGRLQGDLDDDEKWGDSRLFEDLADDQYLSVWKTPEGRSSTDILKTYVAARAALANQKRFKVPAYRHPHACLNPVWVDFGNSRWSIEWSPLKAIHETRKLMKKLEAAKTDAARKKINDQLGQRSELHEVTLGLWNGEQIESVALRWQGNRFHRDLALDHFGAEGAELTRADRVSRAAGNAPDGPVKVLNVFDLKDWNGRLQVDRDDLERLNARLRPGSAPLDDPSLWDETTRKIWLRLRWFLTTSAKLQPRGPFLDYMQQSLPVGWKANYKKGFLTYEPNKAEKRSGRTRIQLARLPGFRVLSIDLGHRYAAAAAVWETLSAEQMLQACAAAGVSAPSSASLYVHLDRAAKTRDDQHSSRTQKPAKRTVYRRIAEDHLPDGTEHPAPWARLDRQFLIRLQGEDRSPRRATAEEFQGFNQFRRFLGLADVVAEEFLDLNSASLKTPQITDLMNQAVRVARLGLRRLTDRARIAFAMTARQRPISGGRSETLNGEMRTSWVQDALLSWHRLATDTEFICSEAAELWNEWIVQKLQGPSLTRVPEEMSAPARKTFEGTLREKLSSVADQLHDASSGSAESLHELWAAMWHRDVAEWAIHLRWLRCLIMPRYGKKPPKSDVEALRKWKTKVLQHRQTGGLSYDRLRAFRGLYECLKAFRMRAEPADLRRNIPEQGSRCSTRFGHRILYQFEQLREQRIKQLASRIVEAAVGVGREFKKNGIRAGRDRKRPTQPSSDQRFQPCHAVVVENLRGYRPEESRFRRTNRQLAEWAAANVRKYVSEGCELHGLCFEEVPAAYTSRQDSRTGCIGVRAEDVPRVVFVAAVTGQQRGRNEGEAHRVREVALWRKEIARAEKRVEQKKADARDRLIGGLAAMIRRSGAEHLPELILLPKPGGELFLPSIQESGERRPRTLQADLNASANVGLVALLDPDFPGTWWRVKVNPRSGVSNRTDYPGCPLFEQPLELLHESQRGGKRDRQNAFSNPSCDAFSSRSWMNQWQFWPAVLEQCCQNLAEWYGIRWDSDSST